MFIRNRAGRALMGAALWLASGCQTASFVGHDVTVGSGTSVPLDLQVSFGPGKSQADGQLVACVAVPQGWSAPGGSYTYNGGERTEGQALAEVTEEARQAHALEGATWHCLVSEQVRVTSDAASLGTARLLLPVPAVAQGAYRLAYVTGFREVVPPETDGGEPMDAGAVEPTYSATDFTGRLERVLHVNVAPATTFDHWDVASFGATGAAFSVTRVTYGNGQFLASTEAGLVTSTDGRTWTAFTPQEQGTEEPLPVTQPVFALGRWFSLAQGALYASTDDARTWSLVYRAPPLEGEETGREFQALAESGGRLAATGARGLIAVSSDGTTWTDQSVDVAYGFPRLTGALGTFLAVGVREGEEVSTGHILVRPRADGSGWETLQAAPLAGRDIIQVAGGNGRFLAFTWKEAEEPPPPPPPSRGGTPPEEAPGLLFLSEDLGTTWQPVRGVQPPGNAVLGQSTLLAFVDSTFVVGGTLTQVATEGVLMPLELRASADGHTWTTHATGAAGTFSGESFATGEGAVVLMNEEVALVASRRAWAGPELVTQALPTGVVGVAYSATVEARGGGGGTTLSAQGTLPAGLGFSAGTFSGVPTEAGTTQVTVTARDVRGTQGTRTYPLEVVRPLAVTGRELARAVRGRVYEESLTAEGGRAPFTWSHTGTLPEGLSLQERSGAYVLQGTPAVTGTFSVTVRVADALGQSAERTVALQVDAPPQPQPQPEPQPEPVPPQDEPQSCGCNGSGAAGLEVLGFAALALLRRARRKP